jgi:hypothetical protein
LTTDYEERACMKRLTVDQVEEAVLKKLAAAPLTASS